MNPNTNDSYLEFISAAALAASGHNTQPWKFSLPGDGIRIHPIIPAAWRWSTPADRELDQPGLRPGKPAHRGGRLRPGRAGVPIPAPAIFSR